MKKVLAVMVVGAFLLGGCAADKDPDPTPLPSVIVLPSETVSGWPTPPNITRPPYTEPVEPETTKPRDSATVVPTPSAAVPPAIEFAQRWGKKYSEVPEYAILKAANLTCKALAVAGLDYFSDTAVMAIITDAVTTAGMESKDALEFAQDAQQNYCSSRG